MTVLKITELSLPVLLGEMGLERWPSPGKIPRGLGQGDGAGMALPPLGKGKSMGKGSEMPTRGWFCAPWNWHFYVSASHGSFWDGLFLEFLRGTQSRPRLSSHTQNGMEFPNLSKSSTPKSLRAESPERIFPSCLVPVSSFKSSFQTPSLIQVLVPKSLSIL